MFFFSLCNICKCEEHVGYFSPAFIVLELETDEWDVNDCLTDTQVLFMKLWCMIMGQIWWFCEVKSKKFIDKEVEFKEVYCNNPRILMFLAQQLNCLNDKTYQTNIFILFWWYLYKIYDSAITSVGEKTAPCFVLGFSFLQHCTVNYF